MSVMHVLDHPQHPMDTKFIGKESPSLPFSFTSTAFSPTRLFVPLDRNMAQEEGDIHSHNSHQSTSSTSALHNNNNQRKDSDDEAESTNTEVIIYGQ